MTTGRINQVTILARGRGGIRSRDSRPRTRVNLAPEGSARVVKRKGPFSPVVRPATGARDRLRGSGREACDFAGKRSHPVFPPEFPRVTVRRRITSAVRSSCSMACVPQVEVTFRWSRPERRLPARACPRLHLRIVLTNGQTSTDSDSAA
jgi:hypothetical protein